MKSVRFVGLIYTVVVLVVLSLVGCGGDTVEPTPSATPVVATPVAVTPLVTDAVPTAEVAKPAVATPVQNSPVLEVRTVQDNVRSELSELDTEPEGEENLSPLFIAQGVVGTNVTKRRVPTGVSKQFTTNSGTLWGFVKVNNPGPPTHITMEWKRNGAFRSRMKIEVGTSPGWRTWSRQRIRAWDAGQWTVEVFDAQERLLETMTFAVKKATPPLSRTRQEELEEEEGC